jgi:hypothetical protein
MWFSEAVGKCLPKLSFDLLKRNSKTEFAHCMAGLAHQESSIKVKLLTSLVDY